MAEAEKQTGLKVKLESMDIAEEKREQLKSLFPEAFSEGRVDFDQLKRALGEWVEPGKERFGLSWPGKANCMKIIQQPSVATLKPSRDESVNFDDTENLFIEGDNLEVLKLLQKSYFGKVKIIYIDPPYNTGKEFIYPDKYCETLDTYLEYTGQKDSNGRRFSTNTDAVGRYHSNWLNMMYPRLYLARNLLTEDGVIFVSIDDHEQANLKALCDQIFGEENFVAEFIRKITGGRQDSKHYAISHEYIICFSKSEEDFFSGKNIQKVGTYPKFDRHLKRNYKTQLLRKWGDNSKKEDRPNLFYPIKSPDGSDHYPMLNEEQEGRWRWSESTMKKAFIDNQIEFKKNHQDRYVAYQKIYEPLEGEDKYTPHYSIIDNVDHSTGAGLLKKLLDEKVFDYPKPVDFIEKVISLTHYCDNDIILDFFAGSATTAHSVMELNKEDGGNRKYIMVQLPEPCDEKSEAYKADYKTIADIGKERIRRAGKKIAEELSGQLDLSGGSEIDLGFKVFKLARSNFKVWEGDVEKVKNLEQQLFDHIDHINYASTPEDILYELLLKSGFPLTTKVGKLQLAGKDVFSIEGGALLICLDKNLTQEVIDAIADTSPMQVICLDDGFKGNDQLKANAVQTFKARAKEKESEIVFRTV